jgi:hypothetical protein
LQDLTDSIETCHCPDPLEVGEPIISEEDEFFTAPFNRARLDMWVTERERQGGREREREGRRGRGEAKRIETEGERKMEDERNGWWKREGGMWETRRTGEWES